MPVQLQRPPLKTGFTLSEVLIALALLGIIAAFAIPKIMQSSRNAERDARLKEAIGLLSELTYTVVLTNEVHSLAEYNTYLSKHLNTTKICPTNHITEECYPNVNDDDPAAAYILSTGTAIADIDTFADRCTGWPAHCYDNVILDYNGAQPPNVYGEDRVQISINLNTSPYLNLKAGQVGRDPGFSDTHPNTLLFERLTQR